MEFLPSLATLLAFSAASFLLAATPGPDMTLSISRALRDGRLAGLAVLIGTNLGIAVHTLLVAFGVSALIVASPTAFMVLKSGGAAYLAWLAFQAVRKGSKFVAKAETGEKGSAKSAFLNGIWVNLLNPKVIIFFMTFLPQFVSAGDPHVTGKLIFLGFWFMVVSLPVTVAIVLAADRLSAWLQANPKVLRGIDLTFAGVFSIFAVKILMTQSR
ncbi:LysE family translocator [Rhizobium paknamense]|uniref:Threonine/homoserine/homoserine lactone efflux protein n=1 Tax=Rhizobium paknamense TaxID=1206817 RepID=A0ABU0IEJ0_9HYPH|nr:LysE family translocator [Rhizobium paknamense]MDQ0456655.1 threonine/homoserine/homoserine lactone efflux protein [Rhizobium paknamense]